MGGDKERAETNSNRRREEMRRRGGREEEMRRRGEEGNWVRPVRNRKMHSHLRDLSVRSCGF